MKRVALIAASLTLVVAAALGLSACEQKVAVRTGTKTVCTYGHTIADDVKTVEVASEDAASYQVRTVTEVCDRHKKLESLYGDAQKALGSGDTNTAKAKLTEVVAVDKAFANARTQLDEISAGKTPKPDATPTEQTSGGTQPPKEEKPGDADTSGPSGSLKGWMPDSLAGFTAQKPVVEALTISRTYTPAEDSKAFTFVIVAEQFRSPKDAQAALSARIKGRYPKDAATLSINGHKTYFGTDGKRFAAAGLTDGSVMVALEMSADDGVAPKTLRGLIEGVLKQLP